MMFEQDSRAGAEILDFSALIKPGAGVSAVPMIETVRSVVAVDVYGTLVVASGWVRVISTSNQPGAGAPSPILRSGLNYLVNKTALADYIPEISNMSVDTIDC